MFCFVRRRFLKWNWPIFCLFLLLFGVVFMTVQIVFWVLNPSDHSAKSAENRRLSDLKTGNEDLWDENDETLRKTLGFSDCSDLKSRILDLLRIKRSVRQELSQMEEKRGLMNKQLNSLLAKIEELKLSANRESTELERLKMSINQAKVAQKEFLRRNTPEIRAPYSLKFVSERRDSSDIIPIHEDNCQDLDSCFDYARCSLTSGFPVYFYQESLEINLPFRTFNPDEACLFVLTENNKELPKYWNNDGRNHLIFDLNDGFLKKPHRALKASSSSEGLRKGFDVVISRVSNDEDYRDLVPIKRKYLIAYLRHSPSDELILKHLNEISSDKTDDQVYIESCPDFNCESQSLIMERSTFTLINNDEHFQLRLSEALRLASVPVIIQDKNFILPFDDFIDWNLVVIKIPLSRLPELHFLLRSYPDSDLFALKRQGQLIRKNYLVNPLITTLNVIRERIRIPAPIYTEEPSPTVFTDFKPLKLDSLPPDLEPGESLGPLEPPSPSDTFRRNFSALSTNQYRLWNNYFNPFNLAPYTPWEPILSTEAKFLGSKTGFRPVGGGTGGTGQEFSQAIGGNVPGEQFTIVMLTYEREQVLINSLSRLYGLPYLNKVLVVWNSPTPPPEDLRWPDIGVPIHVIKTTKNSLNNRFLPFSAVETEAVLSVDDDAHLRHDEIIFGFRVWRENRDKLVGFPGRFHAWDLDHNSWNYNSNYSCELSMVLTGAAFYHKYYSYIYSYEMPQAIRDKVDEYMNCEDLAMNFLISHITRSPPVKVTSRWTFRCPGCPVSLSEDDSHFQERHKCINFFKEIYGYMPLLYTQYRADSVLFKTRIPQDKQKCFKFI